jgi:hypothetical protein
MRDQLQHTLKWYLLQSLHLKQSLLTSNKCYGYGSDQWNYPVSENCLYMNVIRPAGHAHEKLPVAFWIHGGGFYQGGGIDQRYNISFMIENSVKIGKPIIGISINYRLSAWGFLSGSEELAHAGTLNLGLRDQRLALHWVQENIEAFGGVRNKSRSSAKAPEEHPLVSISQRTAVAMTSFSAAQSCSPETQSISEYWRILLGTQTCTTSSLAAPAAQIRLVH